MPSYDERDEAEEAANRDLIRNPDPVASQPVILVTGTKGGVGCSVVATVLAHQLAQDRPTVLVDASRGQSCAAIIGIAHQPTEIARQVAHNLDLWPWPEISTDVPHIAGFISTPIVIDLGTEDAAKWTEAADAQSWFVLTVTTGDYLALRQGVRSPWMTHSVGVVHIDEHGRALGRPDIEDVLGVPVLCSIPHRSEIARAVDAGVLPTRMPEALSRPVRHAAVKLGLLAEVNA